MGSPVHGPLFRGADVNTRPINPGPDPRERETALALIESLEDGVLLWQVACEYMAASRKLKDYGFDPAQAWSDLRDLQAIWQVVSPNWIVLERAENLLTRQSLSFWDSLLIAACLESGVDRLFTEDLSGKRFEGLEVIDPFSA